MRKNILKTSYLFVLCFVFISACAQEKKKSSKTETEAKTENSSVKVENSSGLISPNEFLDIVTSEHQVIDVRTPKEYDSGHIKDAININFYDDDFIDQIAKLDKSKPIVVYCAVGGRSGKAYDKVKKLGFPSFYDIDGGMKAWKALDLPLE